MKEQRVHRELYRRVAMPFKARPIHSLYFLEEQQQVLSIKVIIRSDVLKIISRKPERDPQRPYARYLMRKQNSLR